jgi:hypothetical protein
MKFLFTGLFVALFLPLSLSAQDTPAPATERVPLQRDAIKRKPQNPAQVNLRRFTAQLNGMQEAMTVKDAGKTNAYYSGLLQTMRQAIMVLDQQHRQAAAAAPAQPAENAPAATPAKDLSLPRMRAILDSFEGYSPEAAKPAEVEAKTKLLEEFKQLLKAEAEK